MTLFSFEDLPQRQPPHDYWGEFWSGWPHKVDKQEAEKEFRKATRKTPARLIIEGRDRYIANKPEWQAWMGPAKFIRRRRWEDVYAVPGNPRVDPDKAWQHKAAMAKSSWGRHNVTRQDKEELHRLGFLTAEQLAEALR